MQGIILAVFAIKRSNGNPDTSNLEDLAHGRVPSVSFLLSFKEVADLKGMLQSLKLPRWSFHSRYYSKTVTRTLLVSRQVWWQGTEVQAPVQQIGKLKGQALRLFYIIYNDYNYRYLINTGAEVSVLPPSPADRKH